MIYLIAKEKYNYHVVMAIAYYYLYTWNYATEIDLKC